MSCEAVRNFFDQLDLGLEDANAFRASCLSFVTHFWGLVSKQDLTLDSVVKTEKLVSNYLSQLHEVLLELVVLAAQNFSLVEETWEKSGANFSREVLLFACVECRLQHKEVGY